MLQATFKPLKQALRTTPLRLMVLAQALAIAAQLSVLLTADRYQQLFSLEAASMLGGDLVVNADREPAAALEAAAKAAGLVIAKTTLFNSVVLPIDITSDKQSLVSAKAVDANYPLRGKLTLSETTQAKTAHGSAPSTGQVWVDSAVLKALNLRTGDDLQLGERRFKIAAVIATEPDRGVQFLGFAPRVMLSQADLVSTQLLGAGSRATYRWQMTGSSAAQAQFKVWIKNNPSAGQRLETLEEGRPEMRSTLDRSSRFLGLIAILTTLIAACGLGLVAHIWAKEQSQSVALMRTLGASSRQVAQRLISQVAWASMLGLGLGLLLGWVLNIVLARYIAVVESTTLPAASGTPYLQAVLLLLVLLVACVASPIQQLIRTQPIHILRGQAVKNARGWLVLLNYGVAALCLSALLVWVAGSVTLGLIVLAALFVVVVVVVFIVFALIKLALKLGRQHSRWTIRTAARGLLRNPTLTTVQASTLTLALLGILMLGLLQRDVLGAWQAVLPKDAPNHFVFNIQPNQAADVKDKLIELGVQKPNLQAMIRARVVQINDVKVNLENYPDERAKNLINREFNMSYNTAVPAGNELLGGVWHGDAVGEISMEAGILKTLNLKLGDQLTFDVGGQLTTLKLSSVRKLRWESLNVNFFAIASPSSVKDLPQTFIAAVFVPPSADLTQLLRPFPNLTVLDVGVIAGQGRAVLDKVSRALGLLFVLGVIAGILVIAIIAYASRMARLRETALLRVLGASPGQVRAAQVLEQACIGALAGFIAGTASYLAVQSLTLSVLELPVNIGLWPIWLGALLGAAVNVLGYFALQVQWKRIPLGMQVRSLGL
jgi:putative ABC transport system permease protein